MMAWDLDTDRVYLDRDNSVDLSNNDATNQLQY
jgi:hypothetical protein